MNRYLESDATFAADYARGVQARKARRLDRLTGLAVWPLVALSMAVLWLVAVFSPQSVRDVDDSSYYLKR